MKQYKNIYLVIWENRVLWDRTIDAFEDEKEARTIFDRYVSDSFDNWEKPMDFSKWENHYYDYWNEVFIELEKTRLELS